MFTMLLYNETPELICNAMSFRAKVSCLSTSSAFFPAIIFGYFIRTTNIRKEIMAENANDFISDSAIGLCCAMKIKTKKREKKRSRYKTEFANAIDIYSL